MRILIIEDNPLEQEGARIQLKEHDLTIMDYQDLLFEKEQMEEQDYRERREEESFPKFMKLFEMLLTDLMMPAPQRSAGHPVETPVGFCVLLMGLKYGIKNIGLLTNIHRHQSPLSYAIDSCSIGPKPILVGDTKIVVFGTYTSALAYDSYDPDRDKWVDIYSAEEAQALKDLENKVAEAEEDFPHLKNWGLLYRILLGLEEF